MDKFELATKIAFVLVAKGKNTSDKIVVNGSDKDVVAEFGNMFVGCRVIIDGLGNAVFAYITNRNNVDKCKVELTPSLSTKAAFDARQEAYQLYKDVTIK